MIKPFVYSVCDRDYRKRFGKAFLNSARHHGHQAEIFCREEITVRSRDDAAFFVFWRYELLPELLKVHRHVLLVDIDSVFLGPAEIEPGHDVGLFIRNAHKDNGGTKTLGGVFYCSAPSYAKHLSRKMKAARAEWYADQAVLWDVHREIGGRYSVKVFDNNFIDWRYPTDARIFTAKGNTKTDLYFQRIKHEWERR